MLLCCNQRRACSFSCHAQIVVTCAEDPGDDWSHPSLVSKSRLASSVRKEALLAFPDPEDPERIRYKKLTRCDRKMAAGKEASKDKM